MPGKCPSCGAILPPTNDAFCSSCFQSLDDPAGGPRAEGAGDWLPETEPAPAEAEGPFPVSAQCPRCGFTGFRKARPKRLVAFSWDRICKECGTRYTPPTPPWAAVVFLVAGLLLLVGGGSGVLYGLARGNALIIGCDGFLALLGLLAVIQGIRSLVQPGKV